MKLLTQLAIVLRAWRERHAKDTNSGRVIDYSVEQLETASQEIRVRVAELIAIKTRTERQLADLKRQDSANPELAVLLEDQIATQTDRIRTLRAEMATLDNTVLLLHARKSDLAARESVLQAQENIQRLLVEFNATTLDGALAKIESDLAHREEVFKVLEQLSLEKGRPGPGNALK